MISADADRVFDPNDPEITRDPYPAYAKLRADAPVSWNPRGFWFVSRFDDVRACLNDPRFSNRPAPFALVHQRNKDRFTAADVANNLIAFQDAPEHPPLRSWVARCFATHIRDCDTMLADCAQACVTQLPAGSFDAVGKFALPFSAQAICRILGFPVQDAARVAAWSMDFFDLFHAIPDKANFERLNQNLADFRAYVLARIEQAKTQRDQGFISDLCAAAPAQTDTNVIADNLMLLAADGVGNVQSGLTNCMAVLLRQQALPAQLFASPKDRGMLVDECLRLESPGQYQGRITLEDVAIGGMEIRAHSIVLLGLASANRDPEAFAAPTEFDPTRSRPQHLAFGNGAHMCLGNVLVRKEIGIALQHLFGDGRQLRRIDPALDWLPRPGHRWLRSLNVAWDTP